MDVRMRIAVAENVNVAEFCRTYGVSRQTFYVWRRRFEAGGPDALTPRSRAPRSRPNRVSDEIENTVIALRKELGDQGLDNGPATIHWHLDRRQLATVPSEATIWRILVRRGFITPEPRKRPKGSFRRFQASAPNELWQTDCTDWVVGTRVVKILSFIDDHSRVALRSKVLREATSEATWGGFCEAAERWGLPLGQLSDNGTNFSGRLRGHEVFFEQQLRAAGVVPKTSRPYHPQTCGKVERFQQTLKKWLRRQPLAATITELQAQIDTFIEYYNNERPHRALDRRTPAQHWALTPPAINLGIALPGPAQRRHGHVEHTGVVHVGRYRVNVGKHHAGKPTTMYFDDTHIAIYSNHKLLRALTIDHTQRYQPINR